MSQVLDKNVPGLYNVIFLWSCKRIYYKNAFQWDRPLLDIDSPGRNMDRPSPPPPEETWGQAARQEVAS